MTLGHRVSGLLASSCMAVIVGAGVGDVARAMGSIRTEIRVLPNEKLSELYKEIEATLLARLRKRGDMKGKETESIIVALGAIRSKKAEEVLLRMIEFSNVVSDDPMGVTEGGGKYKSYESFYPALEALMNIGVSMATCTAEIESAEAGSIREGILVRLAYACHGKFFVEYVETRTQDEKPKEEIARWQSVLKQLPRSDDKE